MFEKRVSPKLLGRQIKPFGVRNTVRLVVSYEDSFFHETGPAGRGRVSNLKS